MHEIHFRKQLFNQIKKIRNAAAKYKPSIRRNRAINSFTESYARVFIQYISITDSPLNRDFFVLFCL